MDEHDPENAARPGSSYVIIVEDDADTLDLMHELAVALGHRVGVARTAEDALGLLRGDTIPDLLLLDLGLQLANGGDVARFARDRFGGAVRIVAVTGFVDERRHQEALASGCDHVVTKPVPFEWLEQVLGSVRSAPRPS